VSLSAANGPPFAPLLSDCVGSNNKAGHAGTLTTVQTNFGHVTEARTVIECLTSAQRARGSKQLA
jgi:hypothetical protein